MHFTVISKAPDVAHQIAYYIGTMVRSVRDGVSTVTSVHSDLSTAVRQQGVSADAIITPGNSYGDMSGTFDLAVRDLQGQVIENLVQRKIREMYCGELPVGNALTIYQRSATIPFVIYAPTMRIPKRLPKGSDVPYLSILAAMQQISQHNYAVNTGFQENGIIRSVILTAHGHATGGLPIDSIGRQTAMAIEQVQCRRSLGDPVDWVARDRDICS